VNARADSATASTRVGRATPTSAQRDIVWDARWRGRHGIGRHADEISRRLPMNVEQLAGKGNPASPLDPLRLSTTLARSRPGVFVSPGYNTALWATCPQLITIHDLIHLHDATESSRLKRAYYQTLVGPAIRRTGMVLTVSHRTAGVISEWAQVPLDRVKIVGNGTSIGQASDADFAAADRHRSLVGRYLLYVGNDKSHKNLALLYNALGYIDPSIRLVLVGPSPRAWGDLGTSAIPTDRVVFRPSVTDTELRDLYLKASCLVLPSTDEGFGLPALEAMAVGVRTVYCCDAVQEVVGDLGFRTPADDPRSFAAAVGQCLDADLSDRGDLVARSLLFGWDEVADRVLQAISELPV